MEFNHAEHEVLSRFHDYVDSFSEFLGAFNIASQHAWFLIELPTQNLIPSIRGEVDILAGNLEASKPDEFEMIFKESKKKNPKAPDLSHYNYAAMVTAYNGGLKWPPRFNNLVAIEMKSSYLPPTAPNISLDEIKSKKTSKNEIRKTRRSVDKLLRMGFNQVGLFELLASPPAGGVGSKPWSIASYISGQTLEVMEPVLGERLPQDSPVGHGVASISGINGRDEFASGALSFETLRLPQNNPLLTDELTGRNRQTLEQNLFSILSNLPRPWGMPAVFIYDKKQKTISYANEGSIRC